MTELRKGQRVWVEAEVTDPKPDKWGFVKAHLVRDTFDGEHFDEDIIDVDTDGPMIPPKAGAPTHIYLARREAMMQALAANSSYVSPNIKPYQLAEKADRLLRAIDETPVPEWAGGEG